MKDRVSTEVLSNGALRYAEYDENGVFQQYRYLILDDDPTEVGTPLNAALFNYFNAAVGTTAGTSANYTLAGDGGFSLADGATVRFKLHTDTASGATLDVNSTGALPMILDVGFAIPAGIQAGTWVTATYCSALNAYLVSFAPPAVTLASGALTQAGTDVTSSIQSIIKSGIVDTTTFTTDGITFTAYVVGNLFMAVGTKGTMNTPGSTAQFINLAGLPTGYTVRYGAASGPHNVHNYGFLIFGGITTMSPPSLVLMGAPNDGGSITPANIVLFGTVL